MEFEMVSDHPRPQMQRARDERRKMIYYGLWFKGRTSPQLSLQSIIAIQIAHLSSLHHGNAVFTAAFYRYAVCPWCSVAMVCADVMERLHGHWMADVIPMDITMASFVIRRLHDATSAVAIKSNPHTPLPPSTMDRPHSGKRLQ